MVAYLNNFSSRHDAREQEKELVHPLMSSNVLVSVVFFFISMEVSVYYFQKKLSAEDNIKFS